MSAGTPTPIPTGGKYQPGDRCFARLKGFPWWPAKVKERISGKVEAYKVYFYGSYDEGTVKLDQMEEYNEENFEKYGRKPPRHAKFLLAMQEMQRNMEIVDSSAAGAADLPQNPEQANEGEDEGALLIDEGPPVLTKEVKTPKAATGQQRKNSRAISPDMAEDVPKPTPPKKGGRGSKAITTPTVIDTSESATTPAEPSGPPQPEIVSRSGRKIKPKRFADDFDTGTKSEAGAETSPASKRMKRTTSVGNKTPAEEVEKVTAPQAPAGKRKSSLGRQPSAPLPPPLIPKMQPKNVASSRGPPPLTKGKPDARSQKGLHDEEAPVLEDARFPEGSEQSMEVDDNERTLLLNGADFVENAGEGDEFDEGPHDSIKKIPITGANGVEMELQVNSRMKDRIKSQKEKANFERATKKHVEKMKAELGKSEEAATTFLESVSKNVGKDEDLNGYTVSKLKENTLQQIQLLRSEGETIELVAELVATVGLRETDTEKALDLLEKLGNQKLDTAMLKKHPEVVDTLKQLRRYEGNVEEWAYTVEQKADFAKKAELIRNKSESIYQSFKSLFCSNPPRPFPVPETVKPEPEPEPVDIAPDTSPLPPASGVEKDLSESETPVPECTPKPEIPEEGQGQGQEEKVKIEDEEDEEAETQPMDTEENETSEEQLQHVAQPKSEGEADLTDPAPADADSGNTNTNEPTSTSAEANAPAPAEVEN